MSVANYKQNSPIDVKHIPVVLKNLVGTEVLYLIASLTLTLPDTWNPFNLLPIIVLQDVWFYSVHQLFHKVPTLYQYHKLHHSMYGAFYAWYSTLLEHIIINIASVAVPFWFFRVNSYYLLGLIVLQIYTSIDGHTNGSPHNKHHLNIRKRLGSIYLLDRLFGSF